MVRILRVPAFNIFHTAVFLFAVDRYTKLAALANFGGKYTVIPQWLQVQPLANYRFLFWRITPFTYFWIVMLSAIMLVLLAFICWREYQQKFYWSALFIAIMWIGAFSNLWDRVRWGYVVDWIQVPWWATFNLADVYLVCGAILYLWNKIKKQHGQSQPPD